jgi:beta-glucosidase-like glycosyl hydrolase
VKHFSPTTRSGTGKQLCSRISEKALREIYLKGFEIAVKEADPHCIMTSYNYLNGTETSENYDLLHGILRNEWGWDGLVMTDWGNNSNIVAELNAGNNVKMSSGDLDLVRSAASNGLITRATLEENTMYILNALAHCPDFSINQYKVHAVAHDRRSIISAPTLRERPITPDLKGIRSQQNGHQLSSEHRR